MPDVLMPDQERTRLAKRLIEMCRNVLDASEAHDADSAEMVDEIYFARRVLEYWEALGPKEAFSRAAAFLEAGERWRAERALDGR
jgi:flagellar biosynthesis regulator FlaF